MDVLSDLERNGSRHFVERDGDEMTGALTVPGPMAIKAPNSTSSSAIYLRDHLGALKATVTWNYTNDSFFLGRQGSPKLLTQDNANLWKIGSNEVLDRGHLTDESITALKIGADDVVHDGNVDAKIAAYLAANPPENTKPLFGIWAEENGGLAGTQYEWSFGNGAVGSNIGVVLGHDADLEAVTFNAETFGTDIQMRFARNGVTQTTQTFTANNQAITLGSPISYFAGDRVSFQTGAVINGTFSDAHVCGWFRER